MSYNNHWFDQRVGEPFMTAPAYIERPAHDAQPPYPWFYPRRPVPLPEHHPDYMVYHHVFYFPVPRGVFNDHVYLSAARIYLRGAIGQSNCNSLSELPHWSLLNHLFVLIATDNTNREEALEAVSHRLAMMIEMIEDGEGWFSGLPYIHDNFQVRLISRASGSSEI